MLQRSCDLSAEEPLDLAAYAFQVQQEGVMTKQRTVFTKFDVRDTSVATPSQSLGNLALLPGGEKDERVEAFKDMMNLI